jgi:hypothetical protein
MHLIDQLGFDAVDAGPLANGRLLEPDGSPYATTYTAPELKRRLATADSASGILEHEPVRFSSAPHRTVASNATTSTGIR